VLATGCALALSAGVLGLFLMMFRRHVLQELVFQDIDTAWTVPLGNLLLFIPPVLFGSALAFLFPRAVTLRRATFVFAAAAAYTVVVPLRGIHPLALALVSIGLGARVAQKGLSARARQLLIAIPLLLVALLAMLVRGSLPWRERHAAGATAAGPGTNVVLLILDTVRSNDLSLYGYDRATTPRLTRLAESSTVFDWAIAPSSWTLPSHVAMLTGKRAGEVSARWRHPYDGAFPSIAELLQRDGWATAAFTANYFYTLRESGISRGFTHFEGNRLTVKQAVVGTPIMQLGGLQQLSYSRKLRTIANNLRHFDWHTTNTLSDRKSARAVVGSFLAWQARQGDHPFFAFLNLFDAHKPYRVEAPFDTMFGSDRSDRGDYDRSVAYIDHWVGVLVDSLARRGVLNHTLLIVTSDHGELFGEHGLTDHGNSLYLPVVRVPLLLRLPGQVPAGSRVGTAVSPRHLPATIMALLQPDRAAEFADSSLARAWLDPGWSYPVVSEVERRGNPINPDEPTTRGPMVAVTDGGWHYIRGGDGSEEMYALEADSTESDNRIADATVRSVAKRLRALARMVQPTYPAGKN